MRPPSPEPADPLYLFLDTPSSLPLRGNSPVSVTLINPTDQEKEVHLVIRAQAVYYNGIFATDLWRQKQSFRLRTNQGNSHRLLHTPGFNLGSTHRSLEMAFSPLVLTISHSFIQHICNCHLA